MTTIFLGTSSAFPRLPGAFECTKPFIRDVLRQQKDVAIFVGGAQDGLVELVERETTTGCAAH